MKVLIFDTETTGLPKTKLIHQESLNQWPHIVQFSYIIYDMKENAIVLSRDFLVKMNSDVFIPIESTNIHGITDAMSQEKGENIQVILNEFFYYLRDVDLLVGHNISFDINMIYVELLRIIYFKKYSHEHISGYKADLHFLTNFKNIYCTMQESIDLCAIKVKDLKSGREYNKYPRLSELHEKLFQVVPQNLHNSLIDILTTLRCFMQLKHKKDILMDCQDFIEANKLHRFIVI
jgi:DNA polymerase III epsilon subunit-like protein